MTHKQFIFTRFSHCLPHKLNLMLLQLSFIFFHDEAHTIILSTNKYAILSVNAFMPGTAQLHLLLSRIYAWYCTVTFAAVVTGR